MSIWEGIFLFCCRYYLILCKHIAWEKQCVLIVTVFVRLFRREGKTRCFGGAMCIFTAYGDSVGITNAVFVVSAVLCVAFDFSIVAGTAWRCAVYTALFVSVGIAVADGFVGHGCVLALNLYGVKTASSVAVVFTAGYFTWYSCHLISSFRETSFVITKEASEYILMSKGSVKVCAFFVLLFVKVALHKNILIFCCFTYCKSCENAL